MTDVETLQVEEIGPASTLYPVIDVRSPLEYSQGHIEGAINIPLFDDEERARVGTCYRQQGHHKAVKLGYRLARPKVHQLVQKIGHVAQSGQCVIHCWRGGMRSQAVASLVQSFGMHPRVLKGGYKAFRRQVHNCFETPQQVIILSGLTGSGKTVLLQGLAAAGEQVIDLEELACHRGSAFGAFGMPDRPTVEQFENQLYEGWRKLDPRRPVWLESENQVIGGVVVPSEVWQQMVPAPTVFVNVSRDARVDFLMREYGSYSAEEITEALQKISKRLGGARLKQGLEALENGDRAQVARLALEYYDKAYHRAGEKAARDWVITLDLDEAGQLSRIEEIAAAGREILRQSLAIA